MFNNDTPNPIKLTVGLALQIREDFFSDFDKDLRDLAEKWNVGYQQLRAFAASQGWHAERRAYRTKFLQDLKAATKGGLDQSLQTSLQSAKFKDAVKVQACEMLISLLKQGLQANLSGVVDKSGRFIPPSADSVAKLGPVLIKTVEHELRVMGYINTCAQISTEALPDQPQEDSQAIAKALKRLEDSDTIGIAASS